MRLIDADALEKEFCSGCQYENNKYSNCIDCALAHAPTIEERKWIPCSERLPEPNEEAADGFIKAYLVQDGRWMDVARWNGDCWIAWGYGTALINVTAWMPLPEPWRGEEHEAD